MQFVVYTYGVHLHSTIPTTLARYFYVHAKYVWQCALYGALQCVSANIINREAEVYKKLQVAETTVLDLKQRVRQLTEEAELARRRELNTLLHSSDGLSAPPSPTKQNGDHNHGTDENSNSGNNEDTTATNGTNGVANGSASPLLLPTSLLQKLEEEKQAIAKAYAAIDEERTKLRTELREYVLLK